MVSYPRGFARGFRPGLPFRGGASSMATTCNGSIRVSRPFLSKTMINPNPGGIHMKSGCTTGTRVPSLNRKTNGFVSRCQRSRINCVFISMGRVTEPETDFNREAGTREDRAVDQVVAQVSQPAGSQGFQPADAPPAPGPPKSEHSADWRSATQQVGTVLRFLPAERRCVQRDLLNGPARGEGPAPRVSPHGLWGGTARNAGDSLRPALPSAATPAKAATPQPLRRRTPRRAARWEPAVPSPMHLAMGRRTCTLWACAAGVILRTSFHDEHCRPLSYSPCPDC